MLVVSGIHNTHKWIFTFQKIMSLDPKQRASAKTILQHDYFKQVEMVKPTLGKTPIKTGGKEDFNIFSDSD